MHARILLSALLGLALSTGANAVVTVAGVDYDDLAPVDVLVSSVGDFNVQGGSLAAALTDNSAATFAFSGTPGASVTLAWDDIFLSNGAGADLDIYELGVPDTFNVTVNGVTLAYKTAPTGFSEGGFDLTRVSIDLSDFGFALGAQFSEITLGLDTLDPISSTLPSPAFIAATHFAPLTAPVPEPSTYALMLGGLGLMAWVARRRAV